ncbi:MAG: hypothetical protein J6T10_30345 [Methanobrevibacter sp.]|nr:hypothetical protein [Methanobrevibacter sp.]
MTANLTITENGIISPTTDEIKSDIQGIFVNAFGSDLSLDDATPQGVLIDSLAQLKQASNSVLLYLSNQFDPKTATGIFQDALANLYFIQRKSATHSIVTCRCTGVNGTVLNGISDGNPALAQSTNGDIFECVVGGTIGNPVISGGVTTYTTSGYIDLVFRAKELGPIPCGANTVNSVYQAIVGWDTVNNISSGTVGLLEESRNAFEQRRVDSLALQATGSLAAVQAGIANLSGIEDYKLWENPTGNTVTVSGVTLKPHSIWVCVNSAVSADDVARVLYDNKSAGCDTNGSQSCTYYDNATGVSYNYSYDNPTNQNVYVHIDLAEAVSNETKLEIKQAIWDNFNGLDGSKKISIGETIYASRFLASLIKFGVNILSVGVSDVSTGPWNNSLEFNMNLLPVVGDRPTASVPGTQIIVEVDGS